MSKKNKNLIKVDQNIFYSNVERRLAMKHSMIAIIDLHISCDHGFCPTCEVESPCETAKEIEGFAKYLFSDHIEEESLTDYGRRHGRLTRLKEMFKELISSFREAVYLLTGYKIDLYAATNGGYPRLRLRSMYAEDPDDSLLFQWRDNALELMETPFATKLDQKLFDYLSTCNSVPAFLSNVTMDLFDNQTFMVSR
jgi:hypothetical protein